jgi:hypothetical protein
MDSDILVDFRFVHCFAENVLYAAYAVFAAVLSFKEILLGAVIPVIASQIA